MPCDRTKLSATEGGLSQGPDVYDVALYGHGRISMWVLVGWAAQSLEVAHQKLEDTNGKAPRYCTQSGAARQLKTSVARVKQNGLGMVILISGRASFEPWPWSRGGLEGSGVARLDAVMQPASRVHQELPRWNPRPLRRNFLLACSYRSWK